MKKAIFLVLAGVLCYGVSQAQSGKAFYNSPYKSRNSGSFSKSTGLLSLGLGFPNHAVNDYSYGGWGDNGSPVFFVKYEHGILDEVGVGGEIALGGGRYERNNADDIKIFAFQFAALGYYHFNKLIPVKDLDVWAGAGPAFRNISRSDTDNTGIDDSDFDVTLAVKAGARYYFKPSFGVYGELGYDNMSSINLGVTFRFN